MKLIEFKAENYRSINDSGVVDVVPRTALVGRNESGKTNLLLALESLNPPGGRTALNETKDFPRDRPLSECSSDTVVVRSKWSLNEDEQQELGKIFPRARGVSVIRVIRRYDPTLTVGFDELGDLAVDEAEMKSAYQSLSRSLSQVLNSVEDKGQVDKELQRLSTIIGDGECTPMDWAGDVVAVAKTLRTALEQAGITLKGAALSGLTAIEQHASAIQNDEEMHKKARGWVVSSMPTFIYLDDYPFIEGHQDIPAYLQRKQQNQLNHDDRYFERLLKVAGLDAEQLNVLLGQDHEKRQQLANRAGAIVTKTIRRLWKDRPLKVRFNLDANHFDTLVSDPEAVYDVEVNLNERSRGFRWFFSFYVTFAADTAGGRAENAVLLLDEPGLHLHALAQRDLLIHFKKDFANQILFTTHSPYMIPTGEEFGSVRTVNISQDTGTAISNTPTGDPKTLFPLMAALCYNLTQALFIGEYNLVLEGVSDFWYLNSVSEYLRDNGGVALPQELILSPAGGAQKIPYMVAFLAAQKLKVVVLFDDEKLARATRKDLAKSKLIRDKQIVLVSAGLNPAPLEADVEDLLDPRVFEAMVAETYKQELAGRALNLNAQIARVVRRYEMAFEELGLKFNKTRPARLFLRQMGERPEDLVTASTRSNFERLFQAITETYENVRSSERGPFE